MVDGELRADGTEGVLFVLALDLRRRRFLIMRLKRLPAVLTEPDESESESELLLEESDEDDELSISARTPG